LPIRKKPYKALVAPGIFVCYRRCVGPHLERRGGLAQALRACRRPRERNGKSVMTFFQAQQHALKMVRGSEGDSDKPITVTDAIDAYMVDLEVRGGAKYNATSVRNHLSSAMLSKVVMLLTETELANWRNGLIVEGLKLSSANRVGKSFKAALALAAKRDKRITNTTGVEKRPQAAEGQRHNAPPRDNYYLPDATILAIVRECHVEEVDFGALIDVLAGTECARAKLSSCGLTICATSTPRRA